MFEEKKMARSAVAERSFASNIAHDLEQRLELHYEPWFLIRNVIIRSQKYLKHLERVSKERKQPLKKTVFVEPILEFALFLESDPKEEYVRLLIETCRAYANTSKFEIKLEKPEEETL